MGIAGGAGGVKGGGHEKGPPEGGPERQVGHDA